MSKLKRVKSTEGLGDDAAAAADDDDQFQKEMEILEDIENAFAGGYSNKRLREDLDQLGELSIEEIDNLIKENKTRLDERERRNSELRQQRLKAAKKRDREDDERRRREFEKRHRNKAKEDKTPLQF